MRLICALVFCALATPVAAQGPCGDYQELTEHLRAKYEERRVWYGLINDRMVAEVWMNVKSGTWTFVQRRLDGVACGVASGQSARLPEFQPEDL